MRNRIVSITFILISCICSLAAAKEHFPIDLTRYMRTMPNSYRFIDIEMFTEKIRAASPSPMYIEEDFNGDGLIDYVVIAKGERGPAKLIGFINNKDGDFITFNLGIKFYSEPGELEVSLSKYRSKTVFGITGEIDQRSSVELKSPAVLVDQVKSATVIYWDGSQFKSVWIRD